MMDPHTQQLFMESWQADDSSVNSTDDLHKWIVERNKCTQVDIRRIAFADCSPWVLDDSLHNSDGSFFTVVGLRTEVGDSSLAATKVREQPVIIQDEIGYLGIICKMIDGVLHLLMQAKIEPGNVNQVQISPTIQATRSNFTQKHGGRKPAYLDYFLNSGKYEVVVDQIQSEQSSRFLGKRNRNVVIVVDEDVQVLPTHRWMTLGQVKAMMAFDNLVNMDTRTVLSCIPLAGFDDERGGSVWGVRQSELADAFRRLNDFKMFDYSKRRVVPLGDLSQWRIGSFAIEHVDSAPFKVICCDIAIEGREVKHWRQPLFEAVGKALFGLLANRGSDGAMRFLVKVAPEAGCFDRAEFGPTLQLEAGWEDRRSEGAVQDRFLELLARGEGVLHDVILSEEGGRFFCEENRNVVIEVCASEACALEAELPTEYVWLDFATLNLMCQFNNVCNIQLRNLLSLLSADEL